MLQAGGSDNTHAEATEDKLAVTSQVRLGFASTYYNMAQALGLQKLQNFMRVRTMRLTLLKLEAKACKDVMCRGHLLYQLQMAQFGFWVSNTKEILMVRMMKTNRSAVSSTLVSLRTVLLRV